MLIYENEWDMLANKIWRGQRAVDRQVRVAPETVWEGGGTDSKEWPVPGVVFWD